MTSQSQSRRSAAPLLSTNHTGVRFFAPKRFSVHVTTACAAPHRTAPHRTAPHRTALRVAAAALRAVCLVHRRLRITCLRSSTKLTSLYLEQVAKRRFDLLHFVEQKLQLPRRVRVPKSTHRTAPHRTSESLLHSRGCAVHSTAAEQSERHSRKRYSMEDAANLKPREISCSEAAEWNSIRSQCDRLPHCEYSECAVAI
jgi:hypothetical protein